MPNLFPTFEVPGLIEESTQNNVQYPISWLFDFEKGDFVMDGSGRMVIADGLTAWTQWCVKAVKTRRFAHLIYSPDYAGEVEDAMRQPTRKAAESEIARTITETLMVDPRTELVRDFSFQQVGDEMLVTFTAVPVIGDPQRLEVKVDV